MMRSCRLRASIVLLAVALQSFLACSDSKTPLQPSATPVSTPTGPSPTGPTQSGPAVTLVGAGDVAVCGGSGSEETARLLDSIPGIVFVPGDLAYSHGTEQQFRECYGPTWGRHRDRTRPSPGNHEYLTANADPYYNYFGDRAGPPHLGYYAYRYGDWEIFSLNSNAPAGEGSAQYQWLRVELMMRPSRCSLAYWHEPVITEGAHQGAQHMRAIWRLLFDQGVDIVINGHDHNYQRFGALDGDLRRNPRGIRQFIVGTGGASLYEFMGGSTFAEVRGGVWGVLKLTLAADQYDWQFLSVPGQSFSDFGRDVCH